MRVTAPQLGACVDAVRFRRATHAEVAVKE